MLVILCVLEQDGFKEGQYWDTATPYHYVRTEEHPQEGNILIVGGEDHQVGMKPKDYKVLISSFTSSSKTPQ